jgi:hypothetical protein
MGCRYAITFSGSSILSTGSYLSYGGVATSSVPYIVPESCSIVALSAAANGIQAATSFSVLQNGTSLISFPFTNQQYIYQNNISYPLNVNDQLAVQINGISITSSFSLTIFIEAL